MGYVVGASCIVVAALVGLALVRLARRALEQVAAPASSAPFVIQHRVVVHTRDEQSVEGLLVEVVTRRNGELHGLVLAKSFLRLEEHTDVPGEPIKGHLLIPGANVRFVEDHDR
jgi:hypothetical protein